MDMKWNLGKKTPLLPKRDNVLNATQNIFIIEKISPRYKNIKINIIKLPGC